MSVSPPLTVVTPSLPAMVKPPPYHHFVSSGIQECIWSLQMAQRTHCLVGPLAHGVALVLPPVGHDDPPTVVKQGTLDGSSSRSSTTGSSDGTKDADSDNDLDDDNDEDAIPYESLPQFWVPPTKATTAAASLLCILPSFWRGRRRRKTKRVMADTTTVHLLDEEASQGEWS
jgi:hypothetical protein